MPGGDDPAIWSVDEQHETPETARARVKRVGSLLTQAEIDLKRARDRELDADHALQQARFEAQLSDNAPKVERGGATVADKQAWVDRLTDEQAFQAKLAEKGRIAAQEHYRRLDTQAMLAQSILKSIDRAFSMGTRDDR